MDAKARGWCVSCLVCLTMIATLSATTTDRRLVDAARRGDKEAVRSLLKQRIDVNAPQADGATALMWAAHWGDLETTDLLIRAGANVNAANDYGATALWLACTNGNALIVERLLKSGADPNTALRSRETALIAAAGKNVDVVRLLLTHGADADRREAQGGQTALMRAVAERRPEVARALIELGKADVNARSTGGFTPLLFAAQQNDQEAARMLLAAGAKVNDASPDTSPLLLASARGYQPLSMLLLDMGADPNAVDSNGYTALHYAASRRNMLDAVKGLLARGANPNARIWKEAAEGERVPIVGVPFLQGKATRVMKGGTIPIGATPFWLATRASNINAMRVLASASADPRLATTETVFLEGSSGRRVNFIAHTTPLMHVAGIGRILGNWHDYNNEEMTFALEAAKLLVELGADVNEANEYGYTPLHGAAYIGADPIVQFLIDKGAKLDVMDKLGQTPLSIARLVFTVGLGDNFDARPRTLFESTANLLLKAGATPLAASGVQAQSELKSGSQIN